MKTIPEDSAIIFCEHYALNMLILYYSQLSKSDNIDFAVDINVPCCITVSDSDISVLVGNLLENALDACSSQKKRERQIVVCGRIENNCLLFTIDNTFENNIRKNPDGVYFSSKHSGTGIGIESARAIVERYKGILRTEQKNGVFYTSVLLNL
jgi:sensor histidine kinase regulating citrate/malate metabolism